MTGLSEEVNDWLHEIQQTQGFNVSLSIQSVTDPNKNHFDRILEWVDYYHEKHKESRPFVIGNKRKLEELFEYCLDRRNIEYADSLN
ncbi:hypothetical protein CN380_21460 [Bacillus sp. AFS017274]|nr:hypothetical protein CN380_21460 [Bacillus sp. AFS017274]